MARFVKGQSGNPNGRPRKRRPNVSAFDILFDKRLTVTQNGEERELSVDEVLEWQSYQAALKGSRLAIRQVLKMIEKRENALAKLDPAPVPKSTVTVEYDADNANDAMIILGLAAYEPQPDKGPRINHLKLTAWAAQMAISRPGRRRLTDKCVEEIKEHTMSPEKLKWPRGARS